LHRAAAGRAGGRADGPARPVRARLEGRAARRGGGAGRELTRPTATASVATPSPATGAARMYPELEIFLYRQGESLYSAVFRLQKPANPLARFQAGPIRIANKEFEDELLLAAPPRYGLKLGHAVFDAPEARRALDQAFALARREAPLRIRLCTDQRSLKL